MKSTLLSIAVLAISLNSASSLAAVGGGDITLKGGTAGNVLFSHGSHVDSARLSCQDCHTKLYLDTRQHRTVTMKEMQQGKSCGSCHNGKRAFGVKTGCDKCHKK